MLELDGLANNYFPASHNPTFSFKRGWYDRAMEVMDMLPILRGTKERRQFKLLKTGQIVENPNQPRKYFDPKGICELAESIRQYGIINPLTVRETDAGYELIAGERRLRASRQAGLDVVPCYVLPSNDENSSLLALVENLQRQDLDFYEEAMGIARLTEKYQLTQQQAADRLGKTQSAVANKLRLLRLPPEVIAELRANHLSERHARALLKLETPAQQLKAAQVAIADGLTVAQTEKYVEQLLQAKPPKRRKHPKVVRDVRLFINTLNRAVDTMRQAGVGAAVKQSFEGNEMVVTIRIPAAPQAGQSSVSE